MVILSSPHSKRVQGASKFINEVDEGQKVVNEVQKIADIIKPKSLITYHENQATNPKDNLNNIIKFHNSKEREIDISLHFNSATFNGSDYTNNPVGIEIYYTSSKGVDLAEKYLKKIVDVTGFKNRGVKYTKNLAFLNKTSKPAILIELCFVNSKADVETYKNKFNQICIALAELITGEEYKITGGVNGVYQVVTESFVNKEYAITFQEELMKKGVKSFLQYKEF